MDQVQKNYLGLKILIAAGQGRKFLKLFLAVCAKRERGKIPKCENNASEPVFFIVFSSGLE